MGSIIRILNFTQIQKRKVLDRIGKIIEDTFYINSEIHLPTNNF